MEACLTRFCRQHLAHVLPDDDGGAQVLLRGLPGAQPVSTPHAVQSADWYHPVAAELPTATTALPDASQRHAQLTEQRGNAERACRAALAGEPRLGAQFEQLLRVNQRYAVIREEQARDLTLAWRRRAYQERPTAVDRYGAVRGARRTRGDPRTGRRPQRHEARLQVHQGSRPEGRPGSHGHQRRRFPSRELHRHQHEDPRREVGGRRAGTSDRRQAPVFVRFLRALASGRQRADPDSRTTSTSEDSTRATSHRRRHRCEPTARSSGTGQSGRSSSRTSGEAPSTSCSVRFTRRSRTARADSRSKRSSPRWQSAASPSRSTPTSSMSWSTRRTSTSGRSRSSRLLYDWVDTRNEFHVDHVFPRSLADKGKAPRPRGRRGRLRRVRRQDRASRQPPAARRAREHPEARAATGGLDPIAVLKRRSPQRLARGPRPPWAPRRSGRLPAVLRATSRHSWGAAREAARRAT